MSLLFGVIIAGFVISYLKLKDIESKINGESQKAISKINNLSDALYDVKKYLKLPCSIETKRQQQSEVIQYVQNALGQGKSSDEIVEALKKANDESMLANEDDLDYVDIDVHGVGSLDIDYWKNYIQNQQKWAAEHQVPFFYNPKKK